MYSLQNIETAPSYDALIRNGFTPNEVVSYYGTSIIDRVTMLNHVKNRNTLTIVKPSPIVKPKPIVKVIVINPNKPSFKEVEDMALEQMTKTFIVDGKKYNMLDMGWFFRFNNMKSSFGLFVPRRRNIELSKWMFENTHNDMDFWLDTMLHEIAHAIDYIRRGTTDHSWQWKQVARAIGCNAERTGHADYDQDNITSRYTLTCKSCGTKRPSHKIKKRTSACTKCCKEHNYGRYSVKYALVQTRNY
tara:strand:- start:788 stop:1525 length:738 start_codon:yes stop_codon:yes gene_type:complete